MRKLLLIAAIALVTTTAQAKATVDYSDKAKMATPLPRPRPAEAAAIDIIPLLQKIDADAQAALADANSNKDVIASTCYTAISQVAEARIAAQNTTGGGLLLAFQKLRDVTRLNSSPVGTALIVGCAPLVQDAQVNMVQFFTQIGAAVLLKGFLIP